GLIFIFTCLAIQSTKNDLGYDCIICPAWCHIVVLVHRIRRIEQCPVHFGWTSETTKALLNQIQEPTF
ncbi:hypothetical protein ACFLRW_06465, partial [Acidobacteriota bacterium]